MSSEDAAFMWSDSEDLAVISDMFQLRIKIITSKGPLDKNPTVNWIYPDVNMKEHADLANVDLGEMVVFHKNDTHFDLIISVDSELTKHLDTIWVPKNTLRCLMTKKLLKKPM